MSIVYTKQSSGRKRKSSSKKLALARQEHQVFLRTIGYIKVKRSSPYEFPDLTVKQVAPTSDNLYNSGGFKKSVDDWKWKKDRQETKETIEEIERKKTRTAPIWNKGAYQYISGEDPKTIGRKV